MSEIDLFIMDDKPQQEQQQPPPDNIEIIERKQKKKRQYTEESYAKICENMRKGREARAKRRAEKLKNKDEKPAGENPQNLHFKSADNNNDMLNELKILRQEFNEFKTSYTKRKESKNKNVEQQPARVTPKQETTATPQTIPTAQPVIYSNFKKPFWMN